MERRSVTGPDGPAKTKKKRQRSRGITRRWIWGSLLWTILILFVGVGAVLVSLRENYYSQALAALRYRVNQAFDSVPPAIEATETARAQAVRQLVEEFAERERFELMLVDTDGRVALTSSGFVPNEPEPMEDYYAARAGAGRAGSYMGSSGNDEHILAYTRLFSYPIRGNITGIRMTTSLRQVDNQMMEFTYVLVLGCALVLFFSIFSGSYFIRSIVLPIRRIGYAARRISDGDYNARIENEYNDEIGALCDIINDMALGLSDTDRMKNDFISSVSHELRTPLTAIRGWGETLLATPPEDRETLEKGMRIILNETGRLGYMVEDLLDVSRMQTGALSINRQPIDLVAEVMEAVYTFETRADSLGVSILCEEPADAAAVSADRNRLRQVFSNILDNALKYSKPGGAVTVDFERGSDTVAVSFSDTGIGIPADEIRHVTERFFRASNSRTGSGIGLSVAAEIVTHHEGRLEIESAMGEGTTVRVVLPLMR